MGKNSYYQYLDEGIKDFLLDELSSKNLKWEDKQYKLELINNTQFTESQRVTFLKHVLNELKIIDRMKERSVRHQLIKNDYNSKKKNLKHRLKSATSVMKDKEEEPASRKVAILAKRKVQGKIDAYKGDLRGLKMGQLKDAGKLAAPLAIAAAIIAAVYYKYRNNKNSDKSKAAKRALTELKSGKSRCNNTKDKEKCIARIDKAIEDFKKAVK